MKYTHPFVGQCVDEIQTANKQIGNTDEEKIIVLKKSAGVPRDHENATGDNDREYFGKAMEKGITVKASQV
jgi:hypothetical protein